MEKAYGSAYVTRNSKGIGCDLTFAWTGAKSGTMEAGLAAKIMYDGQGADVIAEKSKEYAALQNNVESAARRGYVDAVIASEDTR